MITATPNNNAQIDYKKTKFDIKTIILLIIVPTEDTKFGPPLILLCSNWLLMCNTQIE